jgi:manganese-dependent inorganic pyrophosphatase
LIPLFRLMELLLPDGRSLGDPRLVQTSLARVAHVLQARFLNALDEHREEALTLMVGAMSSKAFAEHSRRFPPGHLLVVTGDRPTVQKAAIDYGVRALVITGGHDLDPPLLAAAQARGVNVINSPLDTASTTLLIRSAKVIGGAIEKQYISFRENQLVSEAARALRETVQNLFPVLDDAGKLVGVFSRADLLNVQPVKLVLVDHNEMAQAVTGAEEADILEVIDHHRLGGGLVSREPIRFVNEPLGSTCTIVAKFLHHRDWAPPRPIGICLAAGIISDTLNLTSPTATPTDRAMLEWIAAACDLDAQKFAEEFFAAGSALQTHTPAQALGMDCKTYEENDWRLAVAQIEENGFELFWKHKADLEIALGQFVAMHRLDFACLMVTDITSHTSFLLTAGDERVNSAIDYPKPESRLFELAGVVSRKKQLLPHLMRILSKLEK